MSVLGSLLCGRRRRSPGAGARPWPPWWRLAALVPALAAGVSSPSEPALLVPALPVEAALAGGEAHRYRAELAGGGGWRLAVEQLGIDVALAVRGPGLGEGLVADGPLERRGAEVLVVRPAEPGRFEVEVRSSLPSAGGGRYRLSLEPLPEGSERERAVAAAEEATARAAVAWSAGDAEAAEAAYGEALEGWRALGLERRQAETLHALARIARLAGRTEEALDLYRRVLDLHRALGRTGWEAAAANDLGLTHWQRGELDEAEERCRRALDLYRDLGDRFGAAEAHNNRCLILHSRGSLRPALACYGEALAAFRSLGERREEATLLNNLGFAHFSLGEPRAARQAYEEALVLRRALADRRGEAQTLNNLAVLDRSLGEHEAALARYQASRALLAGEDPRQEASLLNNLGVTYQALGETERAGVYFEQALALRRRTGDRRGEAITLGNLGALRLERGQPQPALDLYRQALDLAREMGDRRAEGLALSYLGEARAAAGEGAQALDELTRAASLLAAVGDRFQEAVALQRLGETFLALGRAAQAREALGRSLAVRRALGDRGGEINALVQLARAGLALGEPAAARTDAEAAVARFESLRGRVASPDLRASLLGARRHAYEVLIDALAALHEAEPTAGFDRRALEVSESARARTLLDLLEAVGSPLRGGDEPELAQQRERLLDRLQLKADRQLALRRRGGEEDGQAAALELEIEQVLAQLDLLEAEIRRRSPRFADLVAPQPVTAAEIQALLDPDTLLLEYALGEEASHLWAVGPSGLTHVPLPARAEVEAAVRRLHGELSSPPGAGSAGGEGGAAAVSRMLLGPVRDHLRPGRRLAVVADGALHLLPFAALPLPEAPPGEAAVPLLARHEVVMLPSASVLASQRRQLAGRPPAPELALVLADPVFDPRDPRLAALAAATGRPPVQAGGALRGDAAAAAAAPPAYTRLAFSRLEAQAIAAQAPAGVTTRLGVEAALPALLGQDLRRFRYLHLATHGVLDTERPALSRLVFSLVDAEGRPREGDLRLADVYGLELAAEAVVLSGCRTALGREVRGEGLVGLARGFLYAGARRAVASLWWVDDRATAELMGRFYRGLWSEGRTPAAALRRAQLSLAEERRWRHPYYWAPFVLQGDWR